MTDYITYWLGSIHTYGSKSAPVILVASHSESIGSDPNKKVRKFVVHSTLSCRKLVKQNTIKAYRLFIYSGKKLKQETKNELLINSTNH